ncbi:glycosyltransferase family 2 protein [Flavobacterium sp. RS13.1]|uniref:glycosyltransferase family 2 protein n=1 Tax=Flavobacterium sp. RS13.1 TaxID=3400345 RepID=UPI003AAC80FE
MKKLIEFLTKHDYTNIVIIDNHSTFPPLLNYFNEIEKNVTIHKLDKNFGHLVFWKQRELFDKYSKGYHVVTDPDINPIEECPGDFLKVFKKKLDQNYNFTKVGFSLKIDDIPETNINKFKIINWESKFYQKKDKTNNFIADIDTTFALYRPKYEYNNKSFYKAIRMRYPYTARHGGWYLDNNNLTKEQRFYFESCNDSSSWRINENGEIIKKMYN